MRLRFGNGAHTKRTLLSIEVRIMRSVLLVIGFLVSLAGCNGDSKGKLAEKKTLDIQKKFSGVYPIKVVATTGMVADLVRNIGGERVRVDQMMGQDVDPHLYRPNTADIAKLEQSDVIFYNGLHLEGKLGDTLSRLGDRIPSIGIGEYLDPARLLTEEGDMVDPHIWFDVKLWSDAAVVVSDTLAAYDPTNAEEYRKRATDYRAQLDALDKETRSEIATIPKEKRLLVTSHDAFRYFGRAYDIEVRGVQGISTESEASVKDVESLVTLIVDRKVKSVFIESSVSPRNVESIMEGCRARGHRVTMGGQLFSDAMGETGTAEGTYIGMIRHNVKTVVNALR